LEQPPPERDLVRLVEEHACEVQQVAFSRDGRRLATSAAAWAKADGRREVRVWNGALGQCLATIACDPFSPGMPFGAVALTSDGELLAYDAYTTRKGEDGRTEILACAKIKDLAAGRTQQTPEGLRGLIRSLAFCGDGRLLAVSSDTGGIVLYDCRAQRWLSREPLSGSTSETSYDMAWSPDSSRLGAVSRSQVRVWDVTTGEMVLALRGAPPRPHDGGFNPRIVWSADGRRLAASSWDQSVSIWDSVDRQTPVARQRTGRRRIAGACSFRPRTTSAFWERLYFRGTVAPSKTSKRTCALS
jgi:WD40 repeat protein